MFAVIEVDSDYDYINGLECIKTFPSEAEAQKFIDDAREIRDNSYRIRSNYIDEYIKSFEFEDIDNHEDWLKFLSQFPGIDIIMTHKGNFHSKLRDYIGNRYTPPGFNPPDVITFGTCLHIVEIKD